MKHGGLWHTNIIKKTKKQSILNAEELWEGRKKLNFLNKIKKNDCKP